MRADEAEEAAAAAAAAADKKAKKGEKKAVNGVLSLPAEIAPYKVAILPLDMRVVAQYGDMLASLRSELSQRGLQYKVCGLAPQRISRTSCHACCSHVILHPPLTAGCRIHNGRSTIVAPPLANATPEQMSSASHMLSQ